MDLVLGGLVFFWFWELAREIPALVFWWQVKEYRWDRILIHLKTSQGKKWLIGPPRYLRYLLILLGLFSLSGPSLAFSGSINFIMAPFLVLGVLVPYQALVFYGFLSLRALKKGFLLGTIRPRWTPKAVGFVLGLFLAEALILGLGINLTKGNLIVAVLLLIGDSALLLGSFFLVSVLNFPTWLWREIKIVQAKKKLAGCQGLVRIAVTGSYGKTSTKVFLTQLLSRQFKVVASPGSVNTPIGLAQTVIDQIKPSTEVLIVEMGAYKGGEIKKMCRLIEPSIGILTAINSQHQALFGSLTAVTKAKYELIETLPQDGLAIFNLDDARVKSLGEKTKKNKKFYSIHKETDFWADQIKVKKWVVDFVFHSGSQKKMSPTAPLLGSHNVSNLVAAMGVANYLGVSQERLREQIKNLSCPEATLKPAGRYQGAWLIDDTWNANADGILAALAYLETAWFQARRIVVLQPLIELGNLAAQEHHRVGQSLGKVADLVFLTNNDFYDDLRKGAGEGAEKFKLPCRRDEIFARLTEDLGPGEVVLFEGREARGVLEKLKGVKARPGKKDGSWKRAGATGPASD